MHIDRAHDIGDGKLIENHAVAGPKRIFARPLLEGLDPILLVHVEFSLSDHDLLIVHLRCIDIQFLLKALITVEIDSGKLVLEVHHLCDLVQLARL